MYGNVTGYKIMRRARFWRASSRSLANNRLVIKLSSSFFCGQDEVVTSRWKTVAMTCGREKTVAGHDDCCTCQHHIAQYCAAVYVGSSCRYTVTSTTNRPFICFFVCLVLCLVDVLISLLRKKVNASYRSFEVFHSSFIHVLHLATPAPPTRSSKLALYKSCNNN